MTPPTPIARRSLGRRLLDTSACVFALALLGSSAGSVPSRAGAQPLDPASVPPALREWVPWVTASDADYGCTRVADALVCAWPGTLELTVTGNDVTFAMDVVLDRRREVPLPGGEGQWPIDVKEGARELAVLADDGGPPRVTLEAGTHRITGRVRFGRSPESLHVPNEIARVLAVVNPTTRIPLERASEGVVALSWATPTTSETPGEDTTDSLSIDVVRRIVDGLPLCVETQITARIGGRARAISLGHALVSGTVPSSVESSLPIQVDADGNIVVQAQSGTHRIRIKALVGNPAATLAAPQLATPWPEQEIWLFAPSELHRQVDVRGASSIDPQSPVIPEDWRSAAAYVLRGGETLTLAEVRRGEADPPPNALRINRSLWLDFDGQGFTARDEISGEMHRAGRLDLLEGELGRVNIGGAAQLITLPQRGPRGARGLEIRSEDVSVEAEWRSDASPTDVPAVAWSEDARSLEVLLNLPPGYTLFATRGVDHADSWLSRWDVGPLFLVLLIAVIFARLFGKKEGVAALVTMVLVFHEDDAPTFVWLAVLVPMAILVLFKRGLFARLVYVVFACSAAALVVIAGMFVAAHLRYALHPQLYTEASAGGDDGSSDGYDMGSIGLLRSADTEEGGSGYGRGGGEAMEEAVAAPEAAARQERMAVTGAASLAAQSAIANAIDGSGSPNGQDVDRRSDNWIDPNAVVQTGHGLVAWRHTSVQLRWSGPVARGHHLSVYLVPPFMQRVLALGRALGILFLLYAIAKHRPGWPEPTVDGPANPPPAPTPEPAPETKPDPTPEPEKQAPSEGVARLVTAVTALALVCTGGIAHAQPPADTPAPTILTELHDRLVAPPACGSSCARIGDAALVANGDTLTIAFVAHTEAQAAVALPGPATAFVPTSVKVDGAASNALRLGEDGRIYLRLPTGVHRVELGASLAGRASIALSFATPPARLAVTATGWTTSGVDENGLVRGSLELRRQLGASTMPTPDAQAATRTADVPVWVSVERHVDVGVQWLVTTTIRRESTTSAPAVVRLDALPGESVLGSEAVIDGTKIVATLGQGVPELVFTSSIHVGNGVALHMDPANVAASEVHRSETWSFACSPLWHCTHEGIAPIRHATGGTFSPTFAPYPGESVRLATTRLRAAPGGSFTVQRASLDLTPGARSREGELSLRVHTSVSNTLRIGLPRGVDVEAVTVDGQRRATQIRGRQLSVGISPQNHDVVVRFRESRGLDFVTTSPRFDIHGSAVNVRITENLPENRWVLFAWGPSWGPIVLYWGHLALVLLIAFILGRVKQSPLKTYEWALLVLGLTQIPLVATMVVAAWFFFVAVQHQRRLKGLAFNAAQVVATFHAFVSACILVSAVWVGLNQRPDMQIVGHGSYSDRLYWYADRASGSLPTATFVSVSVWVWKGLMLAWAFWLAASVVKWAIWAVTPFREAGFFEKSAPRAPNPPQR